MCVSTVSIILIALQDIKNYIEMVQTYEGDITTLNNFTQTADETYVIPDTIILTAQQKYLLSF